MWAWLPRTVPLALAVLLLATPHLLWRWQPARPYALVVVDKTVPTADYREHRGLFWVVNHLKLVTPGGAPYRMDRDYYGFRPATRQGDAELSISGQADPGAAAG